MQKQSAKPVCCAEQTIFRDANYQLFFSTKTQDYDRVHIFAFFLLQTHYASASGQKA